MMKFKYYLFAAFLFLALHSCVVLSTKKYKALLAERDSLSIRGGSLEDTIRPLQSKIYKLLLYR
jgi:chemotaxis protein MotB